MKMPADVLVLDDEVIVSERLGEYLEKLGFAVETFNESPAAIDRMKEKTFDVVITDLKMQGPTGLDVLRFISNQGAGTRVIIITGYATMEAARDAEYSGVFQFVPKPFQLETMGKLVKLAASQRR
jgi:DNA-binding NtrC family response regulator